MYLPKKKIETEVNTSTFPLLPPGEKRYPWTDVTMTDLLDFGI